jgi:hypothetical protein
VCAEGGATAAHRVDCGGARQSILRETKPKKSAAIAADPTLSRRKKARLGSDNAAAHRFFCATTEVAL